MPVIKSAIKKLRRDKKVEIANDKFRKEVESIVKAAKKQKNAASVSRAFSIVDKAVKKNLIHKSRAAHIKSALSKLAKPQKSTTKAQASPKRDAKVVKTKKACDESLASWGGGESPTLRDMVNKDAIILGGSCTGIIGDKKRLISQNNLKVGDSIVLIKSSGPNANAISLIRAVAKKLKKGYLTKLSDGTLFGEAVLAKSNIYAKLVKDLLDQKVDIHYIVNITGHGFRKIMRADKNLTYVIEKMFEPQELFGIIQTTTNLTAYEMYGTFNMGMDYALFVKEDDVSKTLKIISDNGFKGIVAGKVLRGERQVKIIPKNIVYSSETLDLR